MRWILSRKIVRLENFEFITDYFGSLSLSPKRGDEGTLSWAQLAMGHLPHSGP
jgi:hypothetical protein